MNKTRDTRARRPEDFSSEAFSGSSNYRTEEKANNVNQTGYPSSLLKNLIFGLLMVIVFFVGKQFSFENEPVRVVNNSAKPGTDLLLELRDKVSEITSEKNKLNDKLDSTRDRINDLETKISTLTQDRHSLRGKNQVLRKELIIANENLTVLRSLENQMSRKTEELSKALNTLNGKGGALKAVTDYCSKNRRGVGAKKLCAAINTGLENSKSAEQSSN